jgi:hypothetical protein
LPEPSDLVLEMELSALDGLDGAVVGRRVNAGFVECAVERLVPAACFCS